MKATFYRFRVGQNLTEAYREHEKRAEIRAGLGTLVGRVALEKGVVHIMDALEDIEYEDKEAASANNFRSMLGVPLLRDGEPVGVFALARTRVEPFSESQTRLVSTFADQVVIALDNVRLFNETREALERQTATADILKVIASSPDDVQPVFDAIAVQSNRLLNGVATAVYGFVDDVVHLRSFTPVNSAADAALKAHFPISLDKIIWGERARKGEVFCIPDSEDTSLSEGTRELARARGWRSVRLVPLLRDDVSIGVIAVTGAEPGHFADHHVELLRTFADQAVIAISNVELFRQVQARTRELTQSLDDLRAAQDRLVQTEKLASLGQLTAGIAHEIKNPLNFINNFSALSGELIDELDATLAPVTLDEKTRGDVGELTSMLKSNLGKVVQHGKRADSIVKNMLLHLREASGERRSVAIRWARRVSISLITVPGRRRPVSALPSSMTLIQRQERWTSIRKRSPGHS